MLPRRTQGNLLKVDYNSRYLFVYSFIYPCIHSSINITNFFTPRWLNNHVIPDSSAHHFSFNHCEAKKRKKGHNISSIHFPRGTRSPRIPQKKKKTSQNRRYHLAPTQKSPSISTLTASTTPGPWCPFLLKHTSQWGFVV